MWREVCGDEDEFYLRCLCRDLRGGGGMRPPLVLLGSNRGGDDHHAGSSIDKGWEEPIDDRFTHENVE